MKVVCAHHSELSGRLRDALGRYRHQAFIERLGWDVVSTAAQPNREFDRFDQDDAYQIIAVDAQQQVQGCARLLPTMTPYLLGEGLSRPLRAGPAEG